MDLGEKPTEKYESPLSSLDEEKRGKLEEAKKKLHELEVYKNSEALQEWLDDLIIYRFMTGFDWKMDKVLEQITKTLEWRNKMKPESISVKDLAFLDGVEKPMFFPHGYDKEGHPVIYIVFEAIQQLINTYVDRNGEKVHAFLIYVTYVFEYCYKNKVFPEGLHRCSFVIDANGIGLTWTNTIRKFGKIFKEFSDNYSESLFKAHVINAGWTLRTLYSLAKSFMDANTKEKYSVSGSSYDLTQFIDEKYLLKDYGGKSEFIFSHKKLLESKEEEQEGEEEK